MVKRKGRVGVGIKECPYVFPPLPSRTSLHVFIIIRFLGCVMQGSLCFSVESRVFVESMIRMTLVIECPRWLSICFEWCTSHM